MQSPQARGVGFLDGAALWLLAFAASAIIGTHGIVYWDAGDYVQLAISGGKSGLLLGRPLFLFVSRMVLASGIEPAHAESVLRWFWSAAGAVAAPALAVLGARLGLDRRAALVAGAALALSPSFAHTSHQVLTDAPALALSVAALAAAAGAQAVPAGVLLAAAIVTRETAAVHMIAMALLLGRRATTALAVCATVVIAVVVISRPQALDLWISSMMQSAAAHPLGLRHLGMSIVWLLATGPVPVAVGAWALGWRRRTLSPRMTNVALPAAIASGLLLVYPDGSFSPRYLIASVPVACFLAAAPVLAARPRLAALALLLPLAVVPFATRPAKAMAQRGATVADRVAALPINALVVPGHYCPQARLGAAISRRADLEFVCPGWQWPANAAGALDAAIANGRPVAVDVTDGAWMGPREIDPRDEIRAWAAGRQGRDVAGFVVIGR